MENDNNFSRSKKDSVVIEKIVRWIKEIISWIISVGGLIVGIIGLATKSEFGKTVVYTIIIIDSLLLVLLGIYSVLFYLKNRNQLNEKEMTIIRRDHIIEDQENILRCYEKANRLLTSNYNYMISTLQKFLNRWQDVVKQAVIDTEDLEQEEGSLKKHGYSDGEIETKVITIAKQRQAIIVKNLYDDYKRFLSNILKKTQENIESYLSLKNYEFEVSVTIKQNITPFYLSDAEKYISQPCIYTAFRDSRTWARKVRNESSRKRFRMKENSDFMHCLTQGYYIFNNKTRESKDYLNENKEFDKYYNCGVTTILASNKEDQQKLVYGFIACDILNDKSNDDKIMNDEIAMILQTAAHIITAYFDSINDKWFMCQIQEPFWEIIFDKLDLYKN